MSTWGRTASSLAVVALLLGSATACGSEDDGSESSAGEESTEATEAALTPEQEAACDAQVQLGSYEPSPKTLDQGIEIMTAISAGSSAEVKTNADTLIATLEEAKATKNFKVLESEKTLMAAAAVAAGSRGCGFGEVDLTVHEGPKPKKGLAKYEYHGAPATLEAGTYSFGLENTGENFHMIIAAKLKDDYKGTLEDMQKLDEKGFMKIVDGPPAFGAQAAPKQTGFGAYDFSKPGRYVILCPVSNEGEKIPHLAMGMMEEITVS